MAKATVRRENGRIEFLVVFQESTRHEFYWIFSGKRQRSPRRSWRYVGMQGRDFNTDHKPYCDFGSFVDHYARLHQAQVLTVRVYHARRLASMLTKTQHETIHADWTPQDMSAARFDKINKRAGYQSAPHGFFFNLRDRASDNAVFQSKDEVLVYEDICEDCGTKHAFAHFSDGKKLCNVGFVEMRNNPGFEYRGYQNQIGFRFTYRTHLTGATG